MTSKEIEQRIIEEVCKYTATCKRLRRASVDEADARRSSLSMVDILAVATERARGSRQEGRRVRVCAGY